MIEQFAPMKPKKIDKIPEDDDKYIYQQKIDGGNVVVDVELPQVDIIHSRQIGSQIIWNKRSYRYPELVNEIRQGKVLADHSTYIGELTLLDKDGIGRLWLFGQRSHLENNFQIQRMSKLCPVVFYPHHIIRDNNQLLWDMPYIDNYCVLKQKINEGNHVKNIPTFDTPQPLLALKSKIEGIVAKDRYSIYQRGKRGVGWFKQKFLKEKTVKVVSWEQQEVGVKLYTDDTKPVHLAGDRVKTVTDLIDIKGYATIEIEFYAETDIGYRDCSVKRILETKEEI